MAAGQVTRSEFRAALDEHWREIQRLGGIIEGPPHPGLEKAVNDFLVEFRTLETERAKQHKSNTTRLNLIIAGIIALAAWVAIFHH